MARDLEASLQAANIARAETEKRLAKHGLTRQYYLKKLKQLAEAKKDGEPDNRIQLDSIKTIIDLYGDKAPEKRDYDVNLNGNFSHRTDKELLNDIKELDKIIAS